MEPWCRVSASSCSCASPWTVQSPRYAFTFSERCRAEPSSPSLSRRGLSSSFSPWNGKSEHLWFSLAQMEAPCPPGRESNVPEPPVWNLNGQHSLLPQTPYFLNLIHFCCCHSLPGHQGLTGPLYIKQGEEQIVPAFPPWNKSSKLPFISQFALIFLLSLMSASICHLPDYYCFFKIMNNFRHTTVYLMQNTSASMYHHSVFFLYR